MTGPLTFLKSAFHALAQARASQAERYVAGILCFLTTTRRCARMATRVPRSGSARGRSLSSFAASAASAEGARGPSALQMQRHPTLAWKGANMAEALRRIGRDHHVALPLQDTGQDE